MDIETLPALDAYQRYAEATGERRDLDRFHQVLNMVLYYDELYETDSVVFAEED